jgi:hypothetical protein
LPPPLIKTKRTKILIRGTYKNLGKEEAVEVKVESTANNQEAMPLRANGLLGKL